MTRGPTKAGGDNAKNHPSTSLHTHAPQSPFLPPFLQFPPQFPPKRKNTMLDPSAEVPLNRVPVSDSSLHTNDSHGAMNFGARARKTAQNYENYRHWDGGGLQFGGETKPEDDSGVCSPPLWKTSPGTSPQHHQNNYRYLSPASKTQAIVRGQRELMEMIRNMPESSYELSLKDLVEHQRTDVRREAVIEEKDRSNEVVAYRNGKEKRKGEKKGRMMRSESLDNNGGLFLKMVFPFSFGTKSKIKKTNLAMNPCSKVSPKPLPPAGAEGSGKGVDKEWWKRRFSASGESESGGISSNSGSRGSSGSSRSSSSGSTSSRNRHRNGSSTGCWSFFHIRKSKTPK